MPVLDHGIDAKVKIGEGHRYGCWGGERKREPLRVKDGHVPAPYPSAGTVQAWRQIPAFGSVECRYDLSMTDPCCTGCPHRGSGEDYDQAIRGAGR